MTRQMRFLAAAWALLACACASGPGVEPEVAAPAPQESTFGELPAQALNQGQCALVLWSRQTPPLRFLMTLSEPAIARAQVNGRTVELTRTTQTGQPIFGQFPIQHYEGNGLSLSVTFSADNMGALNSGARVPSAVVEYSDAHGWTAIIPAAGLIACQA